MSERKRSIELVDGTKRAGLIDLVPGRDEYRAGTYLWVGDANDKFIGYTRARPRQLSAFAHAILRAIGEEEPR